MSETDKKKNKSLKKKLKNKTNKILFKIGFNIGLQITLSIISNHLPFRDETLNIFKTEISKYIKSNFKYMYSIFKHIKLKLKNKNDSSLKDIIKSISTGEISLSDIIKTILDNKSYTGDILFLDIIKSDKTLSQIINSITTDDEYLFQKMKSIAENNKHSISTQNNTIENNESVVGGAKSNQIKKPMLLSGLINNINNRLFKKYLNKNKNCPPSTNSTPLTKQDINIDNIDIYDFNLTYLTENKSNLIDQLIKLIKFYTHENTLNCIIYPEIREFGKKCNISDDVIEKIIASITNFIGEIKNPNIFDNLKKIIDDFLSTTNFNDCNVIKPVFTKFKWISDTIYNNLSDERKDNIAKFICNLKNKKISGLVKDILIRPKQNKYNFFLGYLIYGCYFMSHNIMDPDNFNKNKCNKELLRSGCELDKICNLFSPISSSVISGVNPEIKSSEPCKPCICQNGGVFLLKQIKSNPIKYINNIKYINIDNVIGIFLDNIIEIKKLININNRKYFQIYIYDFYEYIQADIILEHCIFL